MNFARQKINNYIFSRNIFLLQKKSFSLDNLGKMFLKKRKKFYFKNWQTESLYYYKSSSNLLQNLHIKAM